MSPFRQIRLLLCCLFQTLLVLSVCRADGSPTAQLCADVQINGGVNGTFTIELNFAKAPAAVANFIGLATGQKAWQDPRTGGLRHDPFYNGIIFHRVISGFMNQTGSPAGTGTDGPGYTFKDEFDPSLVHEKYTVSMANSGINTNGSQFFITAAATPWLDGVHTIFGKVIAGQSVCDALNATPVTNERPNTPTSISSITVYGSLLPSVDLATPLLPVLSSGLPEMKHSAGVFTLDYDHRTFSNYSIFHSANLTNWSSWGSGYFGSEAPEGEIDVSVTSTTPSHFYRIVRADYSTCHTPLIVGNTFNFSAQLGGTAALNSTRTGGTWTFAGGSPSQLLSASYVERPYGGRLTLNLSNGFIFVITLHPTVGAYVGQTNVIGFSNVSGTFTVLP